METRFFDTSQGKLSYSINGSGPVILFIHGFLLINLFGIPTWKKYLILPLWQ